jgi:hypothetical protein
MDVINHVNHLCKQQTVEESMIAPICCADERTAKYCGVSVKTVSNIRTESNYRNEGSPLHTTRKKRP